jgi:arylsulfatase A-like enzyme
MDTARRGELSVYGHPGPTSPRLAGLAADGVVFDRAYANANWTIPSHACLLTGFLSSVTRTNFQSARTGEIAPLSPEFKTAASVLREAGFRTASFPSNSYNLCRRFGFDQGFDTLWSGTPRDANLTAALLAHKLVRSPRAADWVTRRLPLDEYVSARALNRKVFRWLDRRAREPFFLFVNYTEPHGTNALARGIKRAFGVDAPPPLWRRDPKTGVPELDEESRRALRRWYEAEIAAVDAEIGRLLDRLKARGIYDDTLVVVTSDHGELLGEHGDFGHVVWLYEPTVRVPLVVKYPEGESAGTRSSRLLSHVDVFAEILARTGRALPDGVQGRPFKAPEQAVLSEYRPTSAFAVPWPDRYGFGQTAILSVALPGFKMIRSDGGTEELFDLLSDPDELRSLADPGARSLVGRELDERLDALDTISRKYADRFKKVKFDSLGYVK